MKIPILSKPSKFYEQLIELMSSFAPIKELSPKEKKVLVDIMLQNYEHRNLPEETRFIIIFSTENRKKMCERLNISIDALYLYTSLLKKKKIITMDNKLPLFLSRIIPNDEFEFTIIFKINSNES